jgi:hypothetical protein
MVLVLGFPLTEHDAQQQPEQPQQRQRQQQQQQQEQVHNRRRVMKE